MHNDVGIDKLSHLADATCGLGLAGNSHDHVRGPGAVDQLVEAIDGAQDRHGIGLGMEGEMPAAAVASSRIGHDRRRQTRRSAVRSMGSCPGGGSSGEHPAGPRPGVRGSGAPR